MGLRCGRRVRCRVVRREPAAGGRMIWRSLRGRIARVGEVVVVVVEGEGRSREKDKEERDEVH